MMENIRSQSTTGNLSGSKLEMYISEIPMKQRRRLCDHLDNLDVWSQLAEDMQITAEEVGKIGRHVEPTNELLKIWGDRYHHKVIELFVVLKRRKLYDAMAIIKEFVDYQYHALIYNRPKENASILNHTVVSQDDNKSSANSITLTSNNSLERSYINTRKLQEFTMPIAEVDYEELYTATRGFHEDEILGKGGFSIVYKGRLKHTDIAVKVLNPYDRNGNKVDIMQSLNELKFLSGYRHNNLLPLFAVSLRGEKISLVYEYMRGGSLEDRLYCLHEWPALKCRDKFNICKGTATGINFLHTFRNKPLIHGDIKPANILLTDSLIPKIGDFGLARESSDTVNDILSTQLDIYNFGIVVLETFTGLKPFDIRRKNKELEKHIYGLITETENNIKDIIDQRMLVLPNEQEMCENMIRIGYNCTAQNLDQRPDADMDIVLDNLQIIENDINRR